MTGDPPRNRREPLPALHDGRWKIARIKDRFGDIDVLEYSPAPHNPVPGITLAGPLEATAHIPIFAWIGTGGPETQADTIAEHYWDIYTKRDGAEHSYAAA